jgi:hypothetical protein
MKNAGDCPFRRKNGIVGDAERVAKRLFSPRFRNEKEKTVSNGVFSGLSALETHPRKTSCRIKKTSFQRK